MGKKDVFIGSWITLNNLSVAEIMADSGFDWLCIDLEHSVIDFNATQNIIIAIHGKGLPAYVRVGENNPLIIKRVLDAGADGIIVPLINSKEDAEKAAQAIRYPPKGKRGVGLARAQKYGFGFDAYKNSYLKKINLIAQIEHIDAVNNLEEILNVDGIDGTFIGPYDLSGSLGKPGMFENSEVKKAIKKYEAVAKKYNKLIGFHVILPDYKLVKRKIKKGYNFLAFSLDIIFLGSICRTELSKVKEYINE